MVISVAVGTAMSASLISIALQISGKVSRELRAFGANIIVEPRVEGLADIAGQKRYLRLEDIVKAKTIFWRHNIVGIAPFLESRADITHQNEDLSVNVIGTWYEKNIPLPGTKAEFPAGAATVSPWWEIEGQWPDADDRILLGISLAGRLGLGKGDSLRIAEKEFLIDGTIATGGAEDNSVVMGLESLQDLKNMQGMVSRVMVSALTKPMDEFAYRDPDTMAPAEYEKWYCTGYVTSIAKQLEEVFLGSTVKPVWRIAETEGKILNKMTLLLYFLTFIALAAAALGVSTTMIMSLLRRVEEIGLMKSIGADAGTIVSLFISEGMMIGIIGGILGYMLSIAVSQYIGVQVFNTGFESRAVLLPIAIGSAIVISITGTLLPIRKAIQIKPAVVLKGAE